MSSIINHYKGKVVSKIIKRGHGFSEWNRLGGKGLCMHLEGVEASHQSENLKSFTKDWMQGGRCYKLQLHMNRARRFLMCSMLSVETKMFTLVFPEGKGLSGGGVC